LEKSKTKDTITETISQWAKIDDTFSNLSRHANYEASKAKNHSENTRLQQMIYGAVEYLCAELIEVASMILYDNNIPTDKIITEDDLFMGMFEDVELRWLFFNIMPSPVVDIKLVKYPELKDLNKSCIKVISIVITYLKLLYKDRYKDLEDSIKEQFPQLKPISLDPIIFTLAKNIKNKGWDMNEPKYFIISLYDNDVIDWKTPLSNLVT
jgi:hypothetical protein